MPRIRKAAKSQGGKASQQATVEQPDKPSLMKVDYRQFNWLRVHSYPGIYSGRTEKDYTVFPDYILQRHKPSKSPDTSVPAPSTVSPSTSTQQSDAPSSSNIPSSPSEFASPTPATVLSTQTLVFPSILPGDPEAEKNDKSKQLLVRFGQFVHTGQLWDIYRGDMLLRDGSSEAIPVVIKTMSPYTFPFDPPDDPHYEDEGGYITETAVQAASNEDRLYRRNLKPLQGSLVPEYYGLFSCDDPHSDSELDLGSENSLYPDLMVMIMEDLGNQASPGMDCIARFSWRQREKIAKCYEILHEVGDIVHLHPQPQHIMRRPNRTKDWVIIDFQQSRSLTSRKPASKQKLLKEEDGLLMGLLIAWRDANGTLIRFRYATNFV